jgi:RNA ligase (TIGR02306 family)
MGKMMIIENEFKRAASDMSAVVATSRKLVTVRKVDAVRAIPGADAIECATVEGWNVVIKKGEFQAGDSCVYFEIDSFLPLQDTRFAFLAKSKIVWNGKEGVRLRTLKLRGQVSQGLILPLTEFPEIDIKGITSWETLRQRDFSAELGIEKWEAPIPAGLSGEVEGAFPSFIRKTDQERIQNLTGVLTDDVEAWYEATIKLDGSSMTVFHNAGQSGVCGRNWQLKESASNSLWRVARREKFIESLQAYGRNIALQGEIIGEGIQGNPEKLRGQAFLLFDVFDIDTQAYLGRQERRKVVEDLRALGAVLLEVPCIEVLQLSRFKGSVAIVLDYAEGPSLNVESAREGVVFKRIDGAFSFKAISNTYLLKHGDR